MLVRRILIVGLLAAALLGCQSSPTPLLVGPGAVASAPLNASSRRLQWPDLSQLRSTPLANFKPLSTTAHYLELPAEDCRLRACRHATLANLLESTARAPSHRLNHTANAQVDALRQQLAGHMAREVRNRAASGALQVYYGLLEAELLSDVLQASQHEVDELVGILMKLNQSGFKKTPELDQLKKQQIELQADRAKLDATINQLNSELKGLIGQDKLDGRLLPAESVVVPVEPLDATGLVQIGLNQRADLHALRELLHRLSPETLTVVKRAVAQLVPPIGAIQTASMVVLPGLASLLPALCSQAELGPMRLQLREALRHREAEAQRAIRAAVSEWESQRQLVAIAKQRVEFEAKRVEEFDILAKAGKPVQTELRKAKLDRLKAEAELVRATMKWKRQDVQVRFELGLLCPHCP